MDSHGTKSQTFMGSPRMRRSSSLWKMSIRLRTSILSMLFFFFQAEDGIRDGHVTGVQTCALPIYRRSPHRRHPGVAGCPPSPRSPDPDDRPDQPLPDRAPPCRGWEGSERYAVCFAGKLSETLRPLESWRISRRISPDDPPCLCAVDSAVGWGSSSDCCQSSRQLPRIWARRADRRAPMTTSTSVMITSALVAPRASRIDFETLPLRNVLRSRRATAHSTTVAAARQESEPRPNEPSYAFFNS